MSIARIIAEREQDVVSCSPETSVQQAARLLAERRIGALPVMQDGQVIGIFSERDLLYCIANEGEAALSREVSSVMTAPAITIDPATDPEEALALMTRRRIRHLPVVDGGRMIYFLSIGDIVKHRVEVIEGEARQMREYITTA
jgi:CBS domain-containing protein